MSPAPGSGPAGAAPLPGVPGGPGLAVDLGSSRVRAALPGRGVILDVPAVTFSPRGASYPVRRGDLVDPDGAGRMLRRLLDRHLPRIRRPVVVVTTPVLGGTAYRAAARTAVEALRPRAVLAVPSATAIALGAGAGPAGPLLVVDLGARLTEVHLLGDGEVMDARRVPLGTADLGAGFTPRDLGRTTAAMVAGILSQDDGPRTREALRRGVLLAGGGALRADLGEALARRWDARVLTAPSPHTAAVRGAAALLERRPGHTPRARGLLALELPAP